MGVVIPYLLSYRTRLLSAMEDEQSAAAQQQQRHAQGQQAAAAGAAAGAEGRGGEQQQQAAKQVKRPGRRPGGVEASPLEAAASPLEAADEAGRGAEGSAGRVDAAGDGTIASKQQQGQGQQAVLPAYVVAPILDTALLLAMLAQPDSGALLRLLQQRNFVDPEEGEKALRGPGRYAELAALYQYTGQVGGRVGSGWGWVARGCEGWVGKIWAQGLG